jgi:hypothetical protein
MLCHAVLQDDDSDDEAELKAELERIRAERAAEAEKRAAEEEAKRQEAIRAEVLGGNPLMAGAEVDFGMKRRWVAGKRGVRSVCVQCLGLRRPPPHTPTPPHPGGGGES